LKVQFLDVHWTYEYQTGIQMVKNLSCGLMFWFLNGIWLLDWYSNGPPNCVTSTLWNQDNRSVLNPLHHLSWLQDIKFPFWVLIFNNSTIFSHFQSIFSQNKFLEFFLNLMSNENSYVSHPFKTCRVRSPILQHFYTQGHFKNKSGSES
jgi:hypothetical protein